MTTIAPIEAWCRDWRSASHEHAQYRCGRCGYELGQTYREIITAAPPDPWGFTPPPGFMRERDDVIRPTRERRRKRGHYRRHTGEHPLLLKSSESSLGRAWDRDDPREPHNGSIMRVSLPCLMQCERCRAVNRLVPPR